MTIQIVSGTGAGPTKLAAFDAALHDAGVANYNLITLSSIVPPGTQIDILSDRRKAKPDEWGHKLYVVKADMRTDTPNEEAWAGIGWVQDRKTGKGLFVEHEGTNEKTVRKDIKQSLESLMRRRRGVDFGPIRMKVTGRTCTNEPVCALAVAVYQAAGWEGDKG